MSKDVKTGTEGVTLDAPIKREGGDIKEVHLRKPMAGELRGLSLTDLLQMDVNALTKLLPRITVPSVTEEDVKRMDPADLVQLGGTVAGFLLQKAAKA